MKSAIAEQVCRELVLGDLEDQGWRCHFVRVDTALGSVFIFAAHREGIDHIVTSEESLPGLIELYGALRDREIEPG
jgi:hypothetical protein